MVTEAQHKILSVWQISVIVFYFFIFIFFYIPAVLADIQFRCGAA